MYEGLTRKIFDICPHILDISNGSVMIMMLTNFYSANECASRRKASASQLNLVIVIKSE